ncbi:MAG: hypothetical protein VX278_03050 [Myxococcota bacterium]|nr:hypothetical protein [Myxococcota bacterium]
MPNAMISNDGKRLICGNNEALEVWSIETGLSLFRLHIQDQVDEELEEDVELMQGAILDMGSHAIGLRLMDAISLWELPLTEQYKLLQSMSEPMAISSDNEHILSHEDGSLSVLERREGRHYTETLQFKLTNLWGISKLVPLSDDCSFVAAALPEGIAAWDLNSKKMATLPLPFAFTTTIHNIPKTRMLAVDNGQSISIFRFLSY